MRPEWRLASSGRLCQLVARAAVVLVVVHREEKELVWWEGRESLLGCPSCLLEPFLDLKDADADIETMIAVGSRCAQADILAILRCSGR